MSAAILFYDIETSGLKGDFGHCFCMGYKFLGDTQAKIVSVLDVAKPCKSCHRVDTAEDALLMKRVWTVLAAADIWVGWYSKGFDWKFLNTRILDAGLPPLPDVAHIDLYYTAKHKLALSSNRLANVQDFLQLPTTKTPLTKRVWRRAQAGHVEDISYIIEHCLADVNVLEEAYMKLRPYVKTHPRVAGKDRCRVCGGIYYSKGLRVTTTLGPRRRLECRDCGACETRAAA